MMNYIRDLRLIPIAVIACACLLALKAADLLLDGGSLIAGDNAPKMERTAVTRTTADVPQPSSSMLSWASQMFNFPDGSGTTTGPVVASLPADRTNNLDITGSVPAETADKDKQAKTEQAKTEQAKTEPAKPPETKPPGTVIPTEPGQPTGAERAILERLQERRQELDTRARELDIRESLIKAAEKRMEGQLTELKATEARITVATQQKDEAQTARFKGLVTMYENMKPRDAAKIFDRLDTAVLLEVVSKIEPRKMADILALMSADAAQHLTVELASQAQQVKQSNSPGDLPKIQGQPTQ
jgi:flagellar motility protein MotE (MotC chaperone)